MLRCPSNDCRQYSFGFRMYKNSSYFAVPKDGVFGHTSLTQLTVLRDDKFNRNLLNDNIKSKMICLKCKHRSTVGDFMSAFENPMKHFDTNNLCDCGGEIWNDFEVIQAPKQLDVEWTEGDSQRAVAVGIKNSLKCEACGKLYGKTEIDTQK